MTRHGRAAAGLALTLLVAACQSLSAPADQQLEARQRQAQQVMAAATPPPLPSIIRRSSSFLGVLDGQEHGDRLPPACDQTLTLRSAAALTLRDIAGRLSQSLQIPVQVDPRIFIDGDDHDRPLRVPPPPLVPAPAGEDPPGFGPGAVAARMALPAASTATLRPDLSGSCAQVLDRVAGHFEVAWQLRSGVLSFDKFLLRTFPVRASATTSQFSASMSSGGNSSGAGAANGSAGIGLAAGAINSGAAPGSSAAGGGSSQAASVSASSDIWSEIDSGLKALIPAGGKFTLSRATGTVTVSAPPRAMADIARYLDDMNRILGATIAVEVSAIYITVTDTDNYGLDLNALYQAGAQSAALTGLVPSISQAPGTGSIAILTPPQGSNNFATHFAGSQLFLNAVSNSNRLADYRSATVSGRNGVTMPITLTTNQDIVRSLQFAIGLQSGATSTSASTSTINYGFSLEVLPRIIGPDTVSVFLSFTANDLTNLQDFAVGASGTLELATIDSRSLWNESPLHVGQTLVIAGTEQEKVNPQKTGIGAASNWLLGGQYKNTLSRTRLILLVTPSIMAIPS